MVELNELMKKFNSKLELYDNGMCVRFYLENGQTLLKKYFSNVNIKTLEGKIIVDTAEPVISYKESTIKGRREEIREVNWKSI